jgi:glycosyltransferase involved in cell wall biosynthesis
MVPLVQNYYIVFYNDLTAIEQGGTETFIEGLISNAPDDFNIHVISAMDNQSKLIYGQWNDFVYKTRKIKILPILKLKKYERTIIPLTLMFVFKIFCFLKKMNLRSGILSLHRIEFLLPFLRNELMKYLFIHSNLIEINVGRNTNSLWRHFTKIRQALERYLLNKCDHIYTVGQKNCNQLRNNYIINSGKISHVTTWYDKSIFKYQEIDKSIIYREFNFPFSYENHLSTYVFIGRLEIPKNPIMAIKIIQKLIYEYNVKAKLIIIGDGSLSKTINEYVSNHNLSNDIAMLGKLGKTDISKILLSSDYMLSTSFTEGVPFTLFEGLASGLPVLTTDTGDSRIIVNVKNGIVFQENDIDIICETIWDKIHVEKVMYVKNEISKLAEKYEKSIVVKEIFHHHKKVKRLKT